MFMKIGRVLKDEREGAVKHEAKYFIWDSVFAYSP